MDVGADRTTAGMGRAGLEGESMGFTPGSDTHTRRNLLEEMFVAEGRYASDPTPLHAAEVARTQRLVDAASADTIDADAARRAREIAAERLADDGNAGRCLCWRCGVVRRSQFGGAR